MMVGTGDCLPFLYTVVLPASLPKLVCLKPKYMVSGPCCESQCDWPEPGVRIATTACPPWTSVPSCFHALIGMHTRPCAHLTASWHLRKGQLLF